MIPRKVFLRTKRPYVSHLPAQQEVNQSLVDDGLVDMDKIGSSNFFWSFPSKVAVTKQNIVDTLKQKIAKVMSGFTLLLLHGVLRTKYWELRDTRSLSWFSFL